MTAPPLAGTAPAAPVTQALAALALGLLLGLQPVTTDFYLPALPLLRHELGASMSAAQLTMSSLILCFGLAQMIWGPLADRFGRRPVLLLGLALYTLASAGCATAGSIESLIVWRSLQGAALACAVVVARAVLRDLFEPTQGAHVMALALSGLGVAALLSPLLGGQVTAWMGWRTTFVAVSAIGLGVMLFVALRLPETLPTANRQALRLGPLIHAWVDIGKHPMFRAWCLLVASSYGGLFTVLAGSAFVYIDVLGLSPAGYGAVMAAGSASYIAGTFVCRRWIARMGMQGTVKLGAWITLSAGLMAASGALWAHQAGTAAFWTVLGAQLLFLFGHGQHQPCAQAGVVAPFPRAAGAASALAGLVLGLVAFCIGKWLGFALDGSIRPLLWGLAFWSAATCAVAWILVQRVPR
jgi:DHA1 family bicyclomycin/chloramphenicol resistance-like MFS transporter